jgi:CBS domain-containing protein
MDKEQFTTTLVKDILDITPVKCVLTTDSVASAYETLKKNNIHSAPVVRPDMACVGFISWLDLTSFLVKVEREAMSSDEVPWSTSLKDDDIEIIAERNKKYTLANVQEEGIAGMAPGNPFVLLKEESTLLDALQLLGKGVHRLAITSEDSPTEVKAILSQRKVIQWIAKDAETRLGPVGEVTVEGAGLLGRRELVAINENEPTIDGFMKMDKHMLTSVVVVGDSGKAKGVLSSTDVSEVADFQELLKPTSEFLSVVRDKQTRAKDFLVSCLPSSTISEVVNLLSFAGVHRVAVVDEDQKPLGVVTLTDISKLILRQFDE